MDINETINHIKKRVMKITSLFPYTEEEINYLTLAYLAMILLDPDIADLVEEAISTTFVYLTDNCLYDEFKRLGITEYLIYKNELNELVGMYEGYSVLCKKLIKEPFIMICTHDLSIKQLMDGIIHELKHAINEIYPAINGLDYYNGLCLYHNNRKMGENLDEAFNSYLSCLYIKILMSLKKYNIDDPGISKIINSLKKDNAHAYSYINLVEKCRIIFQSRKCFWPLYNASLYKNMGPLYDAFDEAFEETLSWGEWLKILDKEKPKELERMENLIAYWNLTEEKQIPRI